MAVLGLIQRGSITIANAASSVNVVRGTSAGFDTTVDPANTILLFSHRHNTDGSGEGSKMVRGRVIDGDTLTFDRGGTAQIVTVEWQLLSFTSGVVVQHRDVTIAADGTATTATSAISAASLGGERFIIANGSAPSASAGNMRHAGRWRFTSTTEVEASVNSTSASITVGLACQVVEYVGATVQAVDISTATGASQTIDTAISSVTAGNTLVFGSGRINNDAPDRAIYHASFPDATTLRLTRNSSTSGQTLTATIYLVSFTDGTGIARYAPAHADGTATVDTTITAVTASKTGLVTSNATMNGWMAGISAATALGRITGTAERTSTTNLRTTKGVATTATTFGVQVVEFNDSLPGPTIVSEPGAQTVILSNETTASFSVTATGTGTLSYDWELEDGVGSGVYANLANGNGATWTGQTAASCSATLTAKTLTGRRVRCNVTDDNGTTTTNAVALTIWDGPQVTTFPATNGSGVSTATLTSDYVTGVGEAIEVRIPLADGDVAVTVTTT
jgi:hypothetical protein